MSNPKAKPCVVLNIHGLVAAVMVVAAAVVPCCHGHVTEVIKKRCVPGTRNSHIKVIC